MPAEEFQTVIYGYLRIFASARQSKYVSLLFYTCGLKLRSLLFIAFHRVCVEEETGGTFTFTEVGSSSTSISSGAHWSYRLYTHSLYRLASTSRN